MIAATIHSVMGAHPVIPKGTRPIVAKSPPEDIPSFVPHARFASIKGQNILFSASQRAIFALNDTAAEIWRSLEDGAPRDAIAGSIVPDGLHACDARTHVQTALTEWERLGLIRRSVPSSRLPAYEQVSQVVAVAGLHIRIVYPLAHAFPTLTFRHLEVEREAVDILLRVVDGDRIHLFRNEDWVLSCSPDELPTVLKGQLLAEVLAHGSYELAIHAAALQRRERLLLLCGQPGAGKTTLTLALAHAGFGFAADDVTLLDSGGGGLGLPFAAAVKPGAWPLLAEICPDLDAAPVFRRPDGRRIRYILPKASVPASPSPRPVGWVVLLRRGRDANARLEPLDPVDALRGLLDGAYAPGGELSGTAFDVLAQVIGSAQVYLLTYSRLQDAVDLLGKACR